LIGFWLFAASSFLCTSISHKWSKTLYRGPMALFTWWEFFLFLALNEVSSLHLVFWVSLGSVSTLLFFTNSKFRGCFTIDHATHHHLPFASHWHPCSCVFVLSCFEHQKSIGTIPSCLLIIITSSPLSTIYQQRSYRSFSLPRARIRLFGCQVDFVPHNFDGLSPYGVESCGKGLAMDEIWHSFRKTNLCDQLFTMLALKRISGRYLSSKRLSRIGPRSFRSNAGTQNWQSFGTARRNRLR
jgi:hypothetical protein